MIKTLWIIPIVLLGIVLLLSSRISAFELSGRSWQVPNPTGQPWVICPDGMPGGAVQSTKDGALVWNYSEFEFSFGSDGCLSGGDFPLFNGVNQIDFGDLSDQPPQVLGVNIDWFSNSNPTAILECDLRIRQSVNWHAGPGLPGPTEFDWQSVAAHEAGHCLGLGHEETAIPKPVMHPAQTAGEVNRELTPDDIAGRNFIYGPPQQMDGDGFEPGDANGDGEINILDVTVILNDILEIAPAPGNGDCNNDGQVNILDVTCVLNIILAG